MKTPKLRKITLKSGTIVLAGKDAKSNEELIKQVEPNEEVFHTATTGSPFVNIKSKPKFGDVKKAATICARYSQDWRDNKSDVFVHRFKGKNIYKGKKMKTGTFGVRKFKVIKIKKRAIERWQ